MKLVSFAVPSFDGDAPRIGRVDARGNYVDLTAATQTWMAARGVDAVAARAFAADAVPPNMVRFIAQSPVSLDIATEASDMVLDAGDDLAADGRRLIYEPGQVRLLPAVTEPPMLRDFMAFEAHLQNIFPRLGREIPEAWYDLPVFYKGNTASIGAHGQDIAMPGYSSDDDFDFEFEFAAVIGQGGTNIAPNAARNHIFGYTIYNDFSARAIQQREMSVGLGPAKGKDFHHGHVLGPWLVTADEIDDVYDLQMSASVNGEAWSSGSTAAMHWRFEDMIAHASRDEPIRAGEVFGSGTVGDGSAMERGGSLRDGDVVELQVDGLGTLRNRVVRR